MEKSKETTESKTEERKKEPSPGTSEKGSAKKTKKKAVTPIEPRTPLKRQRAPVERFQSPAEEMQTPKPKTPHHDDVEVVYKKGIFLAVRGDAETFYLCRTQQNVFNYTKKFKIQWLDMDEKTKCYKFDFLDSTDIECVLTNIKMDRVARETYKLPESEKNRIEMILTKAIRKEKGMPIDDIEIVAKNDIEDDEDDEDDDWEDEPTPKKQKLSKSKTTPSKKGKSSSKKAQPKTKSDKKEKKENKKTPKKEGKKEAKGDKKKGPDKNLKPNLKIKVVEKDPLFETKDHVPFISKRAHTKLVFRAVMQNDMDALKQLLEDDQHIYDIRIPRSIADTRSPLHVALENNNIEMLKILYKDMDDNKNKRLKQSPPPLLIEALETGTYNPVSLGVSFVREITASRGSREGNAAFIKEEERLLVGVHELINYALLKGVKKETIDGLINSLPPEQLNRWKTNVKSQLELAVMRGNIELAGAIMKEDTEGFGYNFLHKDVLTKTTEDLPANIRADSVRKKPSNFSMMTPLHCACINPNQKYIERLLSIEPDINLEDKKGRKPIHYAACCRGTGPLEVLLKKGANPLDTTRRKCTPLFYACTAGRAENADLLLKRAKTGAGDVSDPFTEKFGVGGIDRPNWESICPIHVAAENGDVELLKVLLKHGVKVNKPLSASKNKVTPLMIAAGKGNLEFVRLLVQNGATIEQLDKHKKTALTYAVMNGSVPVASYLLYLGSDPNHADSSGNTLVHYAAAYGWYFVLKLLVNEGGADPKIPNDWKVTPVGVAFMKGHMGLVDFLLKMPGVDINFKNASGMTLLSIACSSSLEKGLDDQVVYLLKKGGDPTITDINGFNALHHLAANTVTVDVYYMKEAEKQKQQNEKMDLTVKIAGLLIEAGCKPTYKTEFRQTAITLAIEKVNTKLITYLVEKGGAISAEKNEAGNNPLHLLAKMCMKNDMASLVRSLNTENAPAQIKENGLSDKMEVDDDNDKALDLRAPENNVPKPSLKREMSKARPEYMKLMVSDVNHDGYTPLLLACEQYAMYKQEKKSPEEVRTALNNGIEFIKAVLELGGANPSQAVQKKYFEGLEPEKEAKQYTAHGKWSAVHFMVKACTSIKDDKSEGLKSILSYKPDLELKNLSGQTALALAVSLKSVCCVELLLAAKANPNVTYIIEKTDDKVIEAPVLHLATTVLSPEMVSKLLTAGAQPDGRNSKTKRTCLHEAVSNRKDEIASLQIMTHLLGAGADVNAVEVEKCSALHLSVNSNGGSSDSSTDYEELLISKGADVFLKCNSGRMPLHYVFKKIDDPEDRTAIDPIDLITLLTQSMKEQQLDETDCNCQSALHLAAYRGATISCLHLIKRKAVVDRLDKDGNTPLSFAVANGHDSCAIILIQNGANVKNNVVFTPKDKKAEPDKNKKPLWRWKPLAVPELTPEKKTYSIFQEAIQKELQGVAHMVLDVSGSIDSRVIEAALRVNQYNVALRLLRKITDRSQLQILNDQQQNLFHVLALHTTPGRQDSFQLKVAQILHEKGVSLSQTDENGCTPLHYAALTHQQYDLAKFFIEKDTALDLNRKDKFDRTVLAAFFWDHKKVTKSSNSDLNTKWLQLFLTKGCSLDILFDLPLPEVPVFDMVSDVVNDYFTTACEYRISPMVFAINFCEVGILRFLLENGASSNFADNRGLTPLMHAVKKNDLVMVKILLNPSYNNDGSKTTPLKTRLSKELSRNVFTITQIDEEEEGEEDVDEDENNEDEDKEEEAEEDEEEAEEEEDEPEQDDEDHDTDVADEEEEDDVDDDEITPESFPSLTNRSSTLSSTDKKMSNEEFETVEQTNNINVNAVDSQGWTVVHHLVCPLDYGTFDNEEMLYVLSKVGTDIQRKDNAGLSPLDHALISGAIKLARRLQMLTSVESSTMEKPVFPSIEVKDSLPVPLAVDYKTDSEDYLKSITEKDMEVEEELKVEVDYCCKYKKVGEVVMDESQKIPYDVTLSKVDVTFGTWGMYNFYKMQVVYQKAQDLYILFTRWGRIGHEGQYQHTPFQKKSEAITEFGKIFRSKTGNYWSNVKSFEKQPKKYRLVEPERSRAKPMKIDFTLQSDIPSKLPTRVQDLVKEMSSLKMMEAAINKQGLNYNLMPFGRLKRETLIEGRKILGEIGIQVKKLESIGKDYSMSNQEKNVQLQECGEKIAKLSNNYYHCIPQKDYVFDRIQPICDEDAYKKQLQHLSNLIDIECAEKIVIGAQSKLSSINPLDYIYQAIGCKIQLLNEDCVESQYILKYIHASCKESHVHAIYKLSRPGEDTTIRSLNLENHKLLWHGSNMSNFVSILHRGLLVAPPEVPVSGALFGEGLYSSDAFYKCQMYSYNANPSSDTRLALLCQVALGKNCVVDKEDDLDTDLKDSDYNSKQIDGNVIPNEDFNVTLPYGSVMPLGQIQENPKSTENNRRAFRMPYREYIVSDPSQVCLRYLVEFSTVRPRK